MSLDNKVVDLADLKVSHDYLLGRDELLSDRINELGSGIDGIQSQITALGNGSPIPVETVAEMTDNTKAYLYTGSEQGYTSGYWYTYDSTQAKFVPRGEYGAGVIIDSTLTVTGNAADAKATGDAIKAVKTFVVQVPGSAAVLSGSITAGDFAKALAAYTAGSGVYAVKDGEVYQLSAVSSSTMTFTQMYHGTMNFIKQIQITSADTFTVTNTALSSSATDTSYSNTASGLTATNVQAAIDENAAAISNTNGRLRYQQIIKESYSNAGSTSATHKATYYQITLSAGAVIHLQLESNNANVKFRVQLRSANNLNTDTLIRQLHYGTDKADRYIYVSEQMATASYLTVWAVETSEAFTADVEISTSVAGTIFGNEQASKSFEQFARDGYMFFNSAYFVRGNWSSYSVLSPNYTNRVSSSIHMTTDGPMIVKCVDGFQFYIFYSLDGGSTVVQSGWVSKYAIPAESEYVVLIRRAVEVSTENADIETFVKSLSYRTGIGSTIADMEAVKETVGTLPAYYTEAWLNARMAAVNDACAFINGSLFAFITDLHFGRNSLKSKVLLKRVIEKTPCSAVVCGGDYALAYGTTEQLADAYNNLLDYVGYIGHDKFFALCGNHDFYTAESVGAERTSYTWGKTYSGIFRPSEEWQLSSQKAGYFCIDNEAQKTRIIALNSCEPPTVSSGASVDGLVRVRPAQVVWLADRILEKTNYRIIVISHIASDPALTGYSANMVNVQKILEAFAAGSSVTIEFSSSYTRTFDFSATTNELICHISGHGHIDESNVLNGVLSISTTCDANYRDDGHGATDGTLTEQAFDVFCIDYDARKIKAVRIGRGTSREWSY